MTSLTEIQGWARQIVRHYGSATAAARKFNVSPTTLRRAMAEPWSLRRMTIIKLRDIAMGGKPKRRHPRSSKPVHPAKPAGGVILLADYRVRRKRLRTSAPSPSNVTSARDSITANFSKAAGQKVLPSTSAWGSKSRIFRVVSDLESY